MAVYLHPVEFHLSTAWLDIINLVQGVVVLILIILQAFSLPVLFKRYIPICFASLYWILVLSGSRLCFWKTMAITETWLDLNNQQTANILNELCPLGFAFMHIPRMNNCGGGVGLLYNKCYKIEKQDVTSFLSFEYMEVLLRTPATVLRIGVLYRPPPSTENGLTATMFFNEFPILLERLAVASGHLLLTGDFSFHVDDRTDSLASRFLDLLDFII